MREVNIVAQNFPANARILVASDEGVGGQEWEYETSPGGFSGNLHTWYTFTRIKGENYAPILVWTGKKADKVSIVCSVDGKQLPPYYDARRGGQYTDFYPGENFVYLTYVSGGTKCHLWWLEVEETADGRSFARRYMEESVKIADLTPDYDVGDCPLAAVLLRAMRELIKEAS